MEEADPLADRLAIIDHGRIVAEGRPADLKASIGGDVVTVAIGPEQMQSASAALSSLEGLKGLRPEDAGLTLIVRDGAGVVANVIRLLDAAGVGVGSISISQPTLDEVFLQATGSRLEGADSNGGNPE